MKLGTLLDPNEARRGTRAFIFNPDTSGVEPLPIDDECVDPDKEVDPDKMDDLLYKQPVVNTEEPEPDDPDA
jgi:hypothetical protein